MRARISAAVSAGFASPGEVRLSTCQRSGKSSSRFSFSYQRRDGTRCPSWSPPSGRSCHAGGVRTQEVRHVPPQCLKPLDGFLS